MIGVHSQGFLVPYETGLFLEKKDFIKAHNYLINLKNKQNAEFIVEKTPTHLKNIPLILKTFVDTKSVVTIRDPRAVVASLNERYKDFSKSLHRVVESLEFTLRATQAGAYLVHYERLITEPNKTLKMMCNFLGVNFETAMLDFHTQKIPWFGIENPHKPRSKRDGDDHVMHRAWQLRQPLFDNREKFRKLLSEYEQNLIISKVSKISAKLGYEFN